MLTTTHALSRDDAHRIKEALLCAAGMNKAASGIEHLAEDLIAAFRKVEEATASVPAKP